MIRKVKLGDIAKLSIGFVGTVTTQYEKDGIPFLRTLNVKPYEIVDDDLKTITREFHEKQKKSQLFEGDIAMVHTGVPGICCVIPKEYDDSNCIDMIVIKPKTDVINPFYLEGYMNTIGYKHIIKQQVGCVQKHFNLLDAKDLEIFVPDLEVQNRIAYLLRLINETIKIKADNINLLERTAKLIFDQWFVKYNFLTDNNSLYEVSGGEIEWNEELGKNIPQGWKVGNLYDIADFINGVACQKFPSDDIENSYPVIKIKEMSDGITDDTDRASLEVPSKYIVEKGNILFSWSATLKVILWAGQKGALNQHIFKVVPKRKYGRAFVYQQIYSYIGNFIRMANARKTTMGHITTDHLKQSRIVLPPEQIARKFEDMVNPIHELIMEQEEEITNLQNMRDWLLPFLIIEKAKII